MMERPFGSYERLIESIDCAVETRWDDLVICEKYGFIHVTAQGLKQSAMVDDTAIQYGTYPDLIKVPPAPVCSVSLRSPVHVPT